MPKIFNMMNMSNADAGRSALKEPRAGLTDREQEVFDLLAKGFTNRQIAEALEVKFYTASTHVKNIYKKLGVRKRAAAVAVVMIESNPALSGGRFSPPSRLGLQTGDLPKPVANDAGREHEVCLAAL